MPPSLDAPEILAILRQAFPHGDMSGFSILAYDDDHLVLRYALGPGSFRPGNSVSGPTLMMLADTATWLLLMAALGPVVNAVTTNLNMHFLKRSGAPALVASATFLRRGRRLAVADVRIKPEGATDDDDALVAQATVSYALPSPE